MDTLIVVCVIIIIVGRVLGTTCTRRVRGERGLRAAGRDATERRLSRAGRTRRETQIADSSGSLAAAVRARQRPPHLQRTPPRQRSARFASANKARRLRHVLLIPMELARFFFCHFKFATERLARSSQPEHCFHLRRSEAFYFRCN